MKSPSHDMCLLYTPVSTSKNGQKQFHPVDTAPRGMTCLHTDVTATLANKKFIELECKHTSSFQSNPLETLSSDKHKKFNGAFLDKEIELST